MTSAEIRQSFLDFFRSHGHTIVPSSSLLPDSPGLLFTNAGMNQFVPIFLNERKPDVSTWAGALAAKDTRAADTQKCIRAGGKHNDLEDVGWDTYHHTLFEMLGNWSFGDYFKKESLTWGWDLLTRIWGIPPKRLFATVYAPDKAKGDPADFDQVAYDIWETLFRGAGLDPVVHIVNGNKKDNFWMMGDTGPCGPCSEIHFNLLPSDDETEGRKLVNSSSPRCIEIWNHVFIQFNAGADGTFSPLPAKHVDTGMGFERVAGIHATTKGFTDFTAEPSNYNADIFTSIFYEIERLCGKRYAATVPSEDEGPTFFNNPSIQEAGQIEAEWKQQKAQELIDVAFRVLADHIRTLSFAIADGILPGTNERNYVIRRILRRAVRYGRILGFKEPFFYRIVDIVARTMGDVFPEVRERQQLIEEVIRGEEETFNKTLDRGMALLNEEARRIWREAEERRKLRSLEAGGGMFTPNPSDVSGEFAFKLADTYGFPIDLTELLAREHRLSVDVAGFNAEMEKQKERSRAAQVRDVITVTEGDSATSAQPTKFLGYDVLESSATLLDIVTSDKDTFLVFDQTPFYAEMGGQAGDTGTVIIGGQTFTIVDTVKDKAGRHLHKLGGPGSVPAAVGDTATLSLDAPRRRAINRHHSAAHLIHWALRKTLGTHVRQAGTSKTPDRMRFDFSHFEQVKPEQLREIERLVNEKVIDNAKVETYETEFDKKPEGTLAFFGDKYGRIVRVVDIGGYSRELCGGTHVASTGEIGPIKIVAEMAIASGTRRLEAVAGEPALRLVDNHETQLKAVSLKLNAGPQDVVEKLESLLAHKAELEKKLKAFEQKAAAGLADELAAQAFDKNGLKHVVAKVEAADPNALRALGALVLGKLGEGVVILGAVSGADKVSVVAFASPAAIKAGHQAGKIVSEICGKLGGKGGGKPDFAMGGGKDAAGLDAALGALR